MIRKFIVATALVGALVGTATAASAKAGNNCPPGFGEPIDTEDVFLLPRIADALDEVDGPYTRAELTAQIDFLDVNQDDKLCYKAVSNLRGQSVKGWGFYYLADDNDQP